MNIGSIFTDMNLVNLLIKSFGIVFSLTYLLYSIVLFAQVNVLNKELQSKGSSIILLVSLAQICLGVTLFIIAIFFL